MFTADVRGCATYRSRPIGVHVQYVALCAVHRRGRRRGSLSGSYPRKALRRRSARRGSRQDCSCRRAECMVLSDARVASTMHGCVHGFARLSMSGRAPAHACCTWAEASALGRRGAAGEVGRPVRPLWPAPRPRCLGFCRPSLASPRRTIRAGGASISHGWDPANVCCLQAGAGARGGCEQNSLGMRL